MNQKRKRNVKSVQNADMNFRWKSIEIDGPPKEDSICMVINARYSIFNIFQACYQKNGNLFIEYNPERYSKIPLDITHYLEINFLHQVC